MAVPRRSWRCHGGHGGATAVMTVPRRCRGDPTAIGPTRGGTAEVLNMFKVSAVPPRRSAVLTVFRGATTINDGTTAEPRRSWRCYCGLCHTSTAVAPRLRCDGTSTAEARRNMLKVTAVPPRWSAVLTVFRGATTINDGTTAEPRRSWRCHCGLCRTSTAVSTAPPVWRGYYDLYPVNNIIYLCVHVHERMSNNMVIRYGLIWIPYLTVTCALWSWGMITGLYIWLISLWFHNSLKYVSFTLCSTSTMSFSLSTLFSSDII